MIDVTKVKRTRNGQEVRIYATDGGKCGTIIQGAIYDKERGWWLFTWLASGAAYVSESTHFLDLVEEPETVEIDIWLNVYENGHVLSGNCCYSDVIRAHGAAAPERIACVNIKRTVTKGEGL